MPGSQFTYKIQDLIQSRFWYVGLVACSRDRDTCQWRHVRPENLSGQQQPVIEYDIHFVNGDPGNKNVKTFSKEFSADHQDLLQIYLVMVVIYAVLTPIQVYATLRFKMVHPITRLLCTGIVFQVHSVDLIYHYIACPPCSTREY